MRGFKWVKSAQRFASVLYNTFDVQRHLTSRLTHRVPNGGFRLATIRARAPTPLLAKMAAAVSL
jgi:hypothetical protein